MIAQKQHRYLTSRKLCPLLDLLSHVGAARYNLAFGYLIDLVFKVEEARRELN